MKKVLIDQGSGAEVVYPNLFKGLGLKAEDLSKYDTTLMGFDGRVVVPEGQISPHEHGRKGGDGKLHCSRLIFSLGGNTR